MEQRLHRAITAPAMVLTIAAGGTHAWRYVGVHPPGRSGWPGSFGADVAFS
jgi:hypothetical protein